ncbi:hypothetical protein ABQG68_19500, partial [Bacillus pumilus]|uniref:hypothetical protein n=1 Tax=Bacillus pumilus TaxID=1408 RepID=UPI00331519DC
DKDKSREVLGGAVAYTSTQQNNSQTASEAVVSAHNITKKELPQSPLTPEQEGFFLKEFSQQIKQKTVELQSGDVASFKTTSGWTDRKYYALFSGVAPGTVIKITAENGRSIYAKVLDALPDIKENTGLILRISNAAAATLFGDAEGKYRVEVRFAP